MVQKSSSTWRSYGENLGLIRIIFYFSYFRLFLAFIYIFGGIRLSNTSKYMVVILTFLSFRRYVFYGEIPPRAQRKSFMLGEKKYVNLCHFEFSQNTF